MNTHIGNNWDKILKNEFNKPYFKKLVELLSNEKDSGAIIYPPADQIFDAFKLCPFDKVKVVLLGQDPYHGPGQANGLSFSVPKNQKIPASLKNVYKEMSTDLNKSIKRSGNLEDWAKQGVLLLNASLTVKEHTPLSHSKIGWMEFTNNVISLLSEKKEGLVFLLWGNFAKSKGKLIDKSKHFVLEAAHPSPLARKAFFGSKPFSQTNNILIQQGLKPIDWIGVEEGFSIFPQE
ncbi:MAG: uracil-DNA glycosylase [Bacteroidales bacterium]